MEKIFNLQNSIEASKEKQEERISSYDNYYNNNANKKPEGDKKPEGEKKEEKDKKDGDVVMKDETNNNQQKMDVE